MEKDSDDISACIKHLEHIVNNGNVSNWSQLFNLFFFSKKN